jgi:DNA repair protein RadC
LLRCGAEAVGDGALLDLWLGLGASRLGERLIESLGGLAPLASAPAARLLGESGLGPARVARLLAARELLERQSLERLHDGPVLSCSATVRAFLRTRLATVPREVFGCLFMDSRHRLIRYESLFLGTVDRAAVHPREVLRRALELNAAAVILAHNHPSGVAEPSASDLALTRDLTELLSRIDVRVLDHLVVGRGAEVSFAERGLL